MRRVNPWVKYSRGGWMMEPLGGGSFGRMNPGVGWIRASDGAYGSVIWMNPCVGWIFKSDESVVGWIRGIGYGTVGRVDPWNGCIRDSDGSVGPIHKWVGTSEHQTHFRFGLRPVEEASRVSLDLRFWLGSR